MPSREMSVQITCVSPCGMNRPISSGAESVELSSQPSMATAPLRTSAPRISRPGSNSASHAAKRSGRRTATLPQMARRAPASKTLCRASRLLMPPPYCTSSEVRAAMRSSTARLRGCAAVEVDHVQAADARLLEAERRFERVAVVGLPAGVVALREAHALAADDVRCGYDFDHGVRGLEN